MQAGKSQKDELTISQASKLLGSRYHNRAPSLIGEPAPDQEAHEEEVEAEPSLAVEELSQEEHLIPPSEACASSQVSK